MPFAFLGPLAQLLAALFRKLGGRARQRAAVLADLQLLKELESFPEFGAGSPTHRTLSDSISRDVARLAATREFEIQWREVEWTMLLMSIGLAVGLGYVTYHLDRHGFEWYSIFPAFFAVIFAAMIPEALWPRERASAAREQEQTRQTRQATAE